MKRRVAIVGDNLTAEQSINDQCKYSIVECLLGSNYKHLESLENNKLEARIKK